MEDFKTFVEDFRAKHPSAKDCGAKLGKGSSKGSAGKGAAGTPGKKRPRDVDLSGSIKLLEDEPATTKILQVAILNARAAGGKSMETLPSLVIGEDIAYIKNDTDCAVSCP